MSRRYQWHSCSDPACGACSSRAEAAEIEREFPEAMGAGEEARLDNWAERNMP